METAELLGGIIVGLMVGVLVMGTAQCMQDRKGPCDMCGRPARVYIEQSIRMCPGCTAKVQELYKNKEKTGETDDRD